MNFLSISCFFSNIFPNLLKTFPVFPICFKYGSQIRVFFKDGFQYCPNFFFVWIRWQQFVKCGSCWARGPSQGVSMGLRPIISPSKGATMGLRPIRGPSKGVTMGLRPINSLSKVVPMGLRPIIRPVDGIEAHQQS